MRAIVEQKLIRSSFLYFLAKVVETVAPGEVFAPNWHHRAIAYAIERLECGEIDRLVVTIPPRQLKSIMLSVAWPAFALGHNPRLRFICASYSASLASRLSRMCRSVMNAPWYREAFPGTVLGGRAAEDDFETTAGGGRYATSVGGTLTGFGGDFVVIDDPINPREAQSAVKRQRTIEWYRETLQTRLDNQQTGRMVLIMQRLHEEDLAGHVLEEGGWHHLNLPATADEEQIVPVGPDQNYVRDPGISLHPARLPSDKLTHLKRVMGSDIYSAQYQQQPIPAGGLMVMREWIKTYTDTPVRQPGDLIVQSWDTASAEGIFNDYSVCVTALVRGNSVYVLDVFRRKLNFSSLLEQTIAQARLWGADTLLVENASSGIALIDTLKHQQNTGVPRPIPQSVTGDKILRMSGVTDRFRAGDVLLPKDAEWLPDLLHELLGFPKTRHDDQVDALIHLLNWSRPRVQRPMVLGMPEFYIDGVWVSPSITDVEEGEADAYHALASDPNWDDESPWFR